MLAAAVVALALGIPVIWLVNTRSTPVPDATVAPLPQEPSGRGDPMAPLPPPAEPIPDSTITAGNPPLPAEDAVRKPADEGTGVAPRTGRATDTASAAVSTSPSSPLVTGQSRLERLAPSSTTPNPATESIGSSARTKSVTPAPPKSAAPPPSPPRSGAIGAVPPLPNAGRGQPAAERSDARQAAGTISPSGGTRESSPPPVEPAAPRAPTTEEEVRAVISQYRSAYERLDAGAVKYVWPSVDEGALMRAFANLESQDLESKQCGVNAGGSSAVVTCSGIARYVRRVGNRTPQAEPREWTFRLRRVGGAWEIERVSLR
jgi:hypothetical protein